MEACLDKKAGDDCVIQRGDWEMRGSCSAPPNQAEDEPMLCTPKSRGKRGAAKAPRRGPKSK